MKTLNVGKFKTHFSQVLEEVQRGEDIAIVFGKKKEKRAVIVPFDHYKPRKRILGILEQKATFKINPDFKLTEDEFLML